MIFWLVDKSGSYDHLVFVLLDAAAAVAALRREEETLPLHCMAAHRRMPTVTALYAYKPLGLLTCQALRYMERESVRTRPSEVLGAFKWPGVVADGWPAEQ